MQLFVGFDSLPRDPIELMSSWWWMTPVVLTFSFEKEKSIYGFKIDLATVCITVPLDS